MDITHDPIRSRTETQQPSGSSFEASFRGFACPQENSEKAVLRLVAREQARQTVRRFVQQYRVILKENGPGLVDQLERWLGNSESDLATCWHRTFGAARLLLRTPDPTAAVPCATALAVHFSACGLPGDWAADLSVPTHYQWGGWLLPELKHITVRSDGVTARVKTRVGATNRSIEFHRRTADWQTESGDPIPLPQVGTGGPRPTLLSRVALDGVRLADSLPLPVQNIPPEIVALWHDSLTLISTHAPIYDAWVQNVVRHIALLEAEPGTVHSGGYHYCDGLIHASQRSSPMSLAELLVHEASHQYFYLLSRLGPADDGSDKELYYSPLVEKERPLQRILFAYHACGNILLLYQLCRKNGVADGGYCARNQEIVMEQLEQLSAPLHNNPALTWIGRSLYDPLVERLS